MPTDLQGVHVFSSPALSMMAEESRGMESFHRSEEVWNVGTNEQTIHNLLERAIRAPIPSGLERQAFRFRPPAQYKK
jgi:hypothetical protein